ncbi:MAG: UbiD family decarboxylase [Alphaproteobacteria bacterium]
MTADTEKFRFRSLVEAMAADGEIEVIDDPAPLSTIADRLEGNPKGTWFRKAGPEGQELAGNIMGSRKRLAASLNVDERDLLAEVTKRLRAPKDPVEIAGKDAPVQQIVLRDNEANLTALPVHLQHGEDGAPYISATLDFSVDPHTGNTNVGMRRLMLRGRRDAGIDLNAPSDLRAIYGGAHGSGDRLPVAFAVGFHPADAIAALSMTPPADELALMGGVRGAPVPVVKCITNDLLVPADAEYIIEGYLDADGWTEPEGPYGEYVGYYGRLKQNPVFHLTAITRREDAVFQTATIGGRNMATTDTAQLCALRTEQAVWTALENAVREPVAVYCPPATGGMYNIRIALNQRMPGEARNAIAAAFGSTADTKHVFVVDPDIDVFDDAQMEWALGTRFQSHRDFVSSSGYRAVPLDPSLQGERSGSKAGFDLTRPFGQTNAQEWKVPDPPVFEQRPQTTVEDALKDGPKFFRELMEATGSDDGREIVRALEEYYAAGRIKRLDDGRYSLD